MIKTTDKPVVTVSGKKSLFKSDLHQRLVQDLPQEGVGWKRRHESNTKSVYIDVDFVDFDVDNVERSSERLARVSVSDFTSTHTSASQQKPTDEDFIRDRIIDPKPANVTKQETTSDYDENDSRKSPKGEPSVSILSHDGKSVTSTDNDERQDTPTNRHIDELSQYAFFNRKLLGQPILHTYWADKSDFENENQKAQFDEWIGQVQASTCTEWAIIIVEDGDLKTQIGTALFKSKLQSTKNRANISSTSMNNLSQHSSSFLDRMKKSLSTIFQIDMDSDRWLTLVNQERVSKDNKAQESYANFVNKLRNVIMASFSKQIELFEEQLRVQRELRIHENWQFFNYFSMQEELAFTFEFLTLFDEALVQYDFLDALFSEYISSSNFNEAQEPLYDKWTSFKIWPPLCLDLSNEHSKSLRKRIVDKEASLLEFRNYLFAKRCDLMLMQNEPWRVAASTGIFIENCISEHKRLKIQTPAGAMKCWSFISSLEVLQKCECYSCTSTMENYSFHTVDIWNSARRNLADLGVMLNLMPKTSVDRSVTGKLSSRSEIEALLSGLCADPHGGRSYQGNEISPQARLRDALSCEEKFAKHLIELTELTLGTYKHIGRKRHALLVGKELADFYLARGDPSKALPFLNDLERQLIIEAWDPLLVDVRKIIGLCSSQSNNDTEQSSDKQRVSRTNQDGRPIERMVV